MPRNYLVHELDESLEIEEDELIACLSDIFEVNNSREEVFRAAYEWFFVPVRPDKKIEAEESIASALNKSESGHGLPWWVVRVYIKRTTTEELCY